jgi:hypothetical protein
MLSTDDMYYLIDLERSISSGLVTYWKMNSHGYTTNPHEAGYYHVERAKQKVESDFDKRTIMVHKDVVEKLLSVTK